MSQPATFDQLVEDCSQQLVPARTTPVRVRGMVPDWLQFLQNLPPGFTPWSLLGCLVGVVLTRLFIYRPIRKEQEKLTASGAKLADEQARLAAEQERRGEEVSNALNDILKTLREIKSSQAAAVDVDGRLAELKPSLEQILSALRGRTGAEARDGARDEVFAKLLDLGLPTSKAEEVAQTIVDVVDRHLSAAQGRGSAPASGP